MSRRVEGGGGEMGREDRRPKKKKAPSARKKKCTRTKQNRVNRGRVGDHTRLSIFLKTKTHQLNTRQ